MKKVLNLSILVFLFALILSAPSVYAKDGNSGKGSSNSGWSDDDSSSDSDSDSDSNDDSSSNSNDDSNDQSNDDSISSSSALEIEADIFTNETIVKVEINDKKSLFSTSAKTRAEIISEIMIKYPTLTSAEIESVLNLETENRSSRANDIKGSDERSNDENKNFGDRLKGVFMKKENKEDGSERNDDSRRKFSAQDVFNRFEGAVKHIEKFILRIETAMGKFKAEGKDTTEVSLNLENAKTDLVQAKEFHAKAKLEWEKRSDASRDLIKSYLDSTKQEIKSSFENLKKALVALKDLRDNSSDDNSGRN